MARIFLVLLMLLFTAYGQIEEIDRKIAKAWEYYEQGRFIKMERISREILNQSLKKDYHKGIAEGYYYLGVAYYSMGNTEEALRYATKALEYSEKHDNYRWKAYAHTLAGEILRSMKKYTDALKHFKKALKLAEENKNEKMLPPAYANIGNIYFETGRYRKAIEFYMRGLKKAKRVNLRKSYIALEHYNLGLSFYKLRDFDRAVENLQEAYSIYTSLKDKKSLADTAFYIAKSYYRKGDLQKAKKILEKNLPIAKQTGRERSYRKLLKKIGGKVEAF